MCEVKTLAVLYIRYVLGGCVFETSECSVIYSSAVTSARGYLKDIDNRTGGC